MAEMVIDARRADLGHGLAVRRVLPYARRRMVGPFILIIDIEGNPKRFQRHFQTSQIQHARIPFFNPYVLL